MQRLPACGSNVATSLATRSASDSDARSIACGADSSELTSSTDVISPSSWSALPRMVARYSRCSVVTGPASPSLIISA